MNAILLVKKHQTKCKLIIINNFDLFLCMYEVISPQVLTGDLLPGVVHYNENVIPKTTDIQNISLKETLLSLWQPKSVHILNFEQYVAFSFHTQTYFGKSVGYFRSVCFFAKCAVIVQILYVVFKTMHNVRLNW